jgi:hypothetical protein
MYAVRVSTTGRTSRSFTRRTHRGQLLYRIASGEVGILLGVDFDHCYLASYLWGYILKYNKSHGIGSEWGTTVAEHNSILKHVPLKLQPSEDMDHTMLRRSQRGLDWASSSACHRNCCTSSLQPLRIFCRTEWHPLNRSFHSEGR